MPVSGERHVVNVREVHFVAIIVSVMLVLIGQIFLAGMAYETLKSQNNNLSSQMRTVISFDRSMDHWKDGINIYLGSKDAAFAKQQEQAAQQYEGDGSPSDPPADGAAK